MHFVTRPRGMYAGWGKGWLGVWVHLLPLPANAGSLCTHERQGSKGTAHSSLDFYPAVQTGRRQIRVSVGISSCQRHPQPLWAGGRASSLQPGPSPTHGCSNAQGEFGRCSFHAPPHTLIHLKLPALQAMVMPGAGLLPPHPLPGQDLAGWSPCVSDRPGCQRQAKSCKGRGYVCGGPSPGPCWSLHAEVAPISPVQLSSALWPGGPCSPIPFPIRHQLHCLCLPQPV